MAMSLQAKSGNAQDIGKNDPLAGLPNPGQAVDAVKGLAGDAKQGGKNVASDLSDLPNPFDSAGAGSIADKVCVCCPIYHICFFRHLLKGGPQSGMLRLFAVLALAALLLGPASARMSHHFTSVCLRFV